MIIYGLSGIGIRELVHIALILVYNRPQHQRFAQNDVLIIPAEYSW